MITLAQAKTLKRGQRIYHTRLRFNHVPPDREKADPVHYVVLAVKTWKSGEYRIQFSHTLEAAKFFCPYITSWDEPYGFSPSDYALTPEENLT